MSLQFIAGGSGSGKTRYLYEKVIKESQEHPEIQYLFIVPEQYTMQTQKELVRLHPRHGLLNIDVLSFKRLAYRVFEDLGVQLPVVLDDMGKSMVIRKVAGKLKKDLNLYGGHLEQPGFISQLKSQISELSQYGVSVEDLEMVEEETDRTLLKEKLGDLKNIYKGFKDYIESHYITAEEILDILCRKLPQWEPLKSSVILLDGYTGFTPVQYRLVQLFMIHAREVLCCISADQREMLYKECSMQHLFYMGRHTVCRLKKMAEEHHIPVEKEVWCSSAFSGSAAASLASSVVWAWVGASVAAAVVWESPLLHPARAEPAIAAHIMTANSFLVLFFISYLLLQNVLLFLL